MLRQPRLGLRVVVHLLKLAEAHEHASPFVDGKPIVGHGVEGIKNLSKRIAELHQDAERDPVRWVVGKQEGAGNEVGHDDGSLLVERKPCGQESKVGVETSVILSEIAKIGPKGAEDTRFGSDAGGVHFQDDEVLAHRRLNHLILHLETDQALSHKRGDNKAAERKAGGGPHEAAHQPVQDGQKDDQGQNGFEHDGNARLDARRKALRVFVNALRSAFDGRNGAVPVKEVRLHEGKSPLQDPKVANEARQRMDQNGGGNNVRKGDKLAANGFAAFGKRCRVLEVAVGKVGAGRLQSVVKRLVPPVERKFEPSFEELVAEKDDKSGPRKRSARGAAPKEFPKHGAYK